MTDKKSSRIADTLTNLSDLITLADPSTVAEFDALLAETIDLVENTNAPIYNSAYGVNDKLHTAKSNALTELNAIDHNNFATQADIDRVTATLTAIQDDYLFSQDIVALNADIAFTLQTKTQTKLMDLRAKVADIEIQAQIEATETVEKKQQEASRILNIFQLAFEASQEFTNFISDQLTQPPKSTKGTVVDIIS